MAKNKLSKELHILQVATDLFLTFGYGKVSMDLVTAKAKVSKPTIYTKFKNKEQLFLAVLKNYRHQHNVAIPQVKCDPSLNPEHTLKDLFGQIVDYFSNSALAKLIRLVIAELGQYPEIHEHYVTNYRVRVIHVLTDYLKEGHFKIKSPELTATQLTGIIKEQTLWIKLYFPESAQMKINKKKIVETTYELFKNIIILVG